MRSAKLNTTTPTSKGAAVPKKRVRFQTTNVTSVTAIRSTRPNPFCRKKSLSRDDMPGWKKLREAISSHSAFASALANTTGRKP